MNKTFTVATLLASVLTVSVSACTLAPTPTPSMTDSVAPTPSQTTLSPAEQDLANAKAAVVTLWSVVDRLTNDPKASLQELDSVAEGTTLTMFQENIQKYRSQRWIGSGDSAVEEVSASSAGTNAQGLSTWSVTACVDSSKTKLVDAKGKSVQGPPYRIRHKSTVVERSAHFFVSSDVAVGTC